MLKGLKKSMMFCLMTVLPWMLLGGISMEAKAESYGENLIVNPQFADSDVSAWQEAVGNAVISTETSADAICDGVTTYGVISGRTSPYECFAQDITGVVENGKKYEYIFYAMLSGDYEGAPADQRELHFAPYVTINGQTSYLGSYSEELQGICTQTLTPYEWTRYEGTFEVNYSGSIDQIVIRLLEQGNNYGQGDCVLGDYYVTGVSLREITEDPVVLENVPALRDAVTAETGEGFIMGTAIDTPDLSDKGVMSLVTTHFNAVTLGNALKPDALFGYSNDKCPGTEEVTFNGEKMTVPKLDFSRAEKLLDRILEWNVNNPDSQIKVRGHVLVWHAQTPEWFFHEDYDASRDYVSKEEMDKRLEWYIATVLEHFTGEESPYYGMFYGWDVVNEAVSDATGTYRTDKENSNEPLSKATHGSNSSWWHVYESNEYIINAFRYANKYAPADVELYYNDYNECTAKKKNGILGLLYDVKDADGTRLDGMGMQGHYSTSEPDISLLESSLRSYATVAGKVQLTELDMTASGSYDGTEATQAAEYERQALRYQKIYETVKRLRTEGVNITGITVWGVIDKNSWLQSASNVGGGTDGKKKQCPLLFDDNYQVKPAYWAFVDAEQMAKAIAGEETSTEAAVQTQGSEAEADTVQIPETEQSAGEAADTDQKTEADIANVSESDEKADAEIDQAEVWASLIVVLVVTVLFTAWALRIFLAKK